MSLFRNSGEQQPQDWRAATTWLAQAGHALTLPGGPRQFAGGLGNLNYLVHLDGQPHVLRRPPSGPLPPGANDMAREYRILSALPQYFELAPKAPVYCADRSVLGAPFLLIEYREGLVVRDRFPPASEAGPDTCRQVAENMIEVLARLHTVDPAAAGLCDLGRPEGMVARQARNWQLRAEQAFDGALPPALRALAAWLKRPAPEAQRTALLHSDFKLDNLILSPATLKPVALIDWDMGTLGDPLLDVATLLSYWTEDGDHPAMLALSQMPTHLPGFPRRAEVLQMYARKTGTDVSDFAYYRLLAVFKLCTVFQQIRRRPDTRKEHGHISFAALVDLLIDFAGHTLACEK